MAVVGSVRIRSAMEIYSNNMEIKTVSIELPIYDMEEMDTYIEDRLNHYTVMYIDQLEDPDDFWDDEDIAHWQVMITHYQKVLLHLRSTYTDKNGNIREEFLDII